MAPCCTYVYINAAVRTGYTNLEWRVLNAVAWEVAAGAFTDNLTTPAPVLSSNGARVLLPLLRVARLLPPTGTVLTVLAALFVKIEIPERQTWDASVVTASGACVARWSQKAPAKFWMPPNAAPLEWGGKHFGMVAVEPGGNKGQRCQPPGHAINAKGPTQDVVFAEDFNSKRNDLKLLGMKIMIFSCFTLNLCALFPLCAADGEPYEALFKTFGGTEIGGYKIEKHRECCDPSDNSLPKTEAVVHFGSMTAEQRRLALVVIMHGAALAAHPKEKKGGGGDGGGGGGGG